MTRGQVVWLLWDEQWGDERSLWGVYSTRELAEADAAREYGPYAPEIQSCAVDAGPGGLGRVRLG